VRFVGIIPKGRLGLHADEDMKMQLFTKSESGRYRPATRQDVCELAAKYAEPIVGQVITSPIETEHFLRSQLAHLEYEVFCVVYLDNRHRVIAFCEESRGTIDGTSVYPREIVKAALRHNAAAVILAHNHPSGVAEPSQSDECITRRLKSALELVDIRVLDHLIIGGGKTTSLANRGLL
jgi:DNA repair protein RadC